MRHRRAEQGWCGLHREAGSRVHRLPDLTRPVRLIAVPSSAASCTTRKTSASCTVQRWARARMPSRSTNLFATFRPARDGGSCLPRIRPEPRFLNGISGGWAVATVLSFRPQGTPLRVSTVSGAVTAPNAMVLWSADGDYRSSSRNDSGALVVQGALPEGDPHGGFNRGGYLRTADYTFGSLPYSNPDVRNPDRFETDATIAKDFHVTEEVYFSVAVRSKCGVDGKTASSVVGLAVGSAQIAEAYVVARISLRRESYARRHGFGGMPQAKPCRVQASSASNPATFLVSALNSTATRCTGSPKWRYLSA